MNSSEIIRGPLRILRKKIDFFLAGSYRYHLALRNIASPWQCFRLAIFLLVDRRRILSQRGI